MTNYEALYTQAMAHNAMLRDAAEQKQKRKETTYLLDGYLLNALSDVVTQKADT